MRHSIYVYKEFIKRDFKRIWLYKWDVLFGNLGFLIDSLSTLFIIFVLTNFKNGIGGWSSQEVILMYLFMHMALSIWETFFVTTMDIPELIQDGTLDVLLMRPINLLLQVIMMEIDEEAMVEALIYTVSFFALLIHVQGFNLLTILLASVLLLTTLALIEGIYLCFSSLAFWIKQVDGVTSIYWQLIQLADYPMSIYPKTIQIVLTIIPVGFMAYYPISLLLHKIQHPAVMVMTILSGPLFFLLVYHTVWKKGLQNYTSFS